MEKAPITSSEDKTNKGPLVLFVDDDKFLLDMYALKFSNSNFNVHTAYLPLQTG